MRKLMISLPDRVSDALDASAVADYRDPRAQAAILICEALAQRGLLTPIAKGVAIPWLHALAVDESSKRGNAE